MKKKDLFSKNIQTILSLAKKKKFYTSQELRKLLILLKEKRLVAQSLPFYTFFNRLVEYGLLQESLFIGDKSITRYYFDKEADIFQKALAFQKGSFLSMSSALNFQGLSSCCNEFIYISREQPPKQYGNKISVLSQAAIDSAFRKPYRRTKSFGKVEGKYIVLLSPKYSKHFSVISYNGVSVSSVNRALVEMVVNVQYFKSSGQIIQTFKPLMDQMDPDEVCSVLEHFDYIYPYYQSLGFYLEKIGFSRKELTCFASKISSFDFYTEKNLNEYRYDTFWRMYY